MHLARLYNTIETFTGINDISPTPSTLQGKAFTQSQSTKPTAFDMSDIDQAGNTYSTNLGNHINNMYSTIQKDLSANSQYINDVKDVGLPIDIITVLYTSKSDSPTFEKMTYADGITVEDGSSDHSYYISLKAPKVFVRKNAGTPTSNSGHTEQFMNFSNQNTIEGLATTSSSAAISTANSAQRHADTVIRTTKKLQDTDNNASTSNPPDSSNYTIIDNPIYPYVEFKNNYTPLSVKVPRAPPISKGEDPNSIGTQFQVTTLMPPTQAAVNTYFKTPQHAMACHSSFTPHASNKDPSNCKIHAAQTLLTNKYSGSSSSSNSNIYYYNDSNNCYTCIDSSDNSCLGQDLTSNDGILSKISSVSSTYKEFYSHSNNNYIDISNALSHIGRNGIVLEDVTSRSHTYYAIDISDVSGYIHAVKRTRSNQKPLSKLTVHDASNIVKTTASTIAKVVHGTGTPLVSDTSANNTSTTFNYIYKERSVSTTPDRHSNNTSSNLTSVPFTRIAAVKQNSIIYYVIGNNSNINGCKHIPIKANQLSLNSSKPIPSHIHDYVIGNTYQIGYNKTNPTQAIAYETSTPNNNALHTSALHMSSLYGAPHPHPDAETLYGDSLGSHSSHSPVSHSSPSPVSHSNHSPVSHSNHSLVSPSGHSPVSHSNHSPVSHSSHSPVSHSNHSPVSHSNHSPVSHSDHSLVSPSNHSLVSPSNHSSIQESFDNNTTTARQNLMQTQLGNSTFSSKSPGVNSKTLININTPGYDETPAHLGNYATTLRRQAGNLTNSTNNNIKESNNILNEISTRQKNITTAQAQHEDAYLNRISNNYHSIAWTIGAVALIGATIKLSK